MSLPEDGINYFKRGEHENPKFWSRLGGRPPMEGCSVLDVGCGHGSLCMDMALADAKKIVGLDMDSHRIEFASENLRQNYPELASIVEFNNLDLKQYNTDLFFDYIISKDSFEHIIDLNEMLREMERRLKPGGKIYAGFGPLYNSPFGDHGRTRTLIPWGHLIVPETIIIRMFNKRCENKISSIHDLGLNRMSLSDYRKVFFESGLSIVRFHVNQSNRIISSIFSLIRRIPFLEEYFSHNIYCILQRGTTDLKDSVTGNKTDDK